MIVDRNPASHLPTRRKFALLSGLSDPESCALSDVQQQFLRQLPVDDTEKVLANFPYQPGDGSPRRSPSLICASWANGRQFWQASGRRYREAATRHWDALVGSCDDLTVITLSCGLEILNSCLVAGVRPAKLRIISLGPVARARPRAAHTLIQGSRDYVSKAFFWTPEVTLPGVAHLNYLDSQQTIELINQILRQRA